MRRRTLVATITIGVVSALVPSSASALTFTVNDTTDDSDSLGGDNICDTTLGDPITCTLRAAIQEANDEVTPVADTINFSAAIANDPDVADRTIVVAGGLPDLTEQVTIDGCALASTQPPTQPCIGVRGVNNSNPIIGSIAANNVVIRGLAFGNATAAFGLSSGSSGLTVENNWFGVDLAGAADLLANGVTLLGDGATVGGTTAGKANVFAYITNTALIVNGDNHDVQGNLFGVVANGTTFAGNGTAIRVVGPNSDNNATNNLIGGTQPAPGTCSGPCNVIANSTGNAILLQSGSNLAEGTTISGNFVGLNQAGALAANGPNAITNVNAIDTTIGGDAGGERNYIAGGGSGISAAAQGAPGLEIRNNFIGLNPAGTASLGAPSSNGIFAISVPAEPMVVSGNRLSVAPIANGILADINGAPITTGGSITNNIIGLGVGNQDLGGGSIGVRAAGLTGATISGNTFANSTFAGISLENSDDNVVSGNRFGTDPSGNGDHWGGSGSGILISNNLGASSGNLIGGTTAPSENLISNIPGSPIVLTLGPNDDNTIARNRGSGNVGIFIDLGQDGPGNGNADAPNNSIDPPTITSATDDVAAGTGAAAGATVLVFRTPDSGDPTDLTAFAGQATASAAGAWQAPINVPNGVRVTALQTDASGDSSELSVSTVTVPDPPETTITGGPRKRSRLKAGKRRKRVTFRFASSEPGEGGFQCQIDNKPFVLCSSASFGTRVKRGKHTFRVRAFDDAGNPDPSLAIRRFRILRPRRR